MVSGLRSTEELTAICSMKKLFDLNSSWHTFFDILAGRA
jgi:hypothetical protein